MCRPSHVPTTSRLRTWLRCPIGTPTIAPCLRAALAYGRPVVATAVGGLPEALAFGGGLLVPPGDPDALAEGLAKVLLDSALRERLEREALAVADRWTWRDAAQATLAVYHRASSQGRETVTRSRPESARARPAIGPPDASAYQPFVSVVMPVLNEAPHVAEALIPLLSGDYPREHMEILVVDGGSSDRTRDIVRELSEGYLSGHLRLVDNPNSSAPTGLNIGIAEARGDIILRMDGHTRPARDYVRACVEALGRSGAWAVGGAMRGFGETAFGRAVALATSHPMGAGDASFRLGGEGSVDTVYLGAWPRAVLETVGGFDPGLRRNQDYELCLRIRAAGGTIWLDPAIQSHTLTRSSLPALLRQYFGYGQGRAATLRRHPRSLRWRQALPAAWLLCLLLLSLLAPVWAWARIGLAGLVSVYLLAVLTASIQLGGRADGGARPWLAPVFIGQHLSWSLGFWWGLTGLAFAGSRRSTVVDDPR